MKHLISGVLAVATACGGSSDGTPMPDAPAQTFRYESFTTSTRSLDMNEGYQISTTDLIGPIACGLSADQSAGLGTSGSQIILAFYDPNFQHCSVGTYPIRSGCQPPPTGAFQTQVSEGCAYYRRYDQQGLLLGTLPAIAGSVGVTGTESACTFQINLSFNGQTYADTFTLTNFPMSWPWCK
jgi:hypothetical protein